MRFDPIYVARPENRSLSIEPLRLQPPDLHINLPFPASLFRPIARRIVRQVLEWARPIIKQVVAWAVENARELLDKGEGAVDELLDDLGHQAGKL